MQTARSSNVVPLRTADSRAVPDEAHVVVAPRRRAHVFIAFLTASLGLHAVLVALPGSWTIRTEPPVPLRPLEVVVVTERPPVIVPEAAPPAPRRVQEDPPAPRPQPRVEAAAAVKREPAPLAPQPVVVPPLSEQAPSAAPAVSSAAPVAAGPRDAQAGASPASAVTPPSLNAAYLSNPPPAYPASARRRGQSGMVLLRVKVSAAGKPDEVRISNSAGVEALDQAALEAVRGWTFVPARRGDAAVEAWVEVPIQFRLEDR